MYLDEVCNGATASTTSFDLNVLSQPTPSSFIPSPEEPHRLQLLLVQKQLLLVVLVISNDI